MLLHRSVLYRNLVVISAEKKNRCVDFLVMPKVIRLLYNNVMWSYRVYTVLYSYCCRATGLPAGGLSQTSPKKMSCDNEVGLRHETVRKCFSCFFPTLISLSASANGGHYPGPGTLNLIL